MRPTREQLLDALNTAMNNNVRLEKAYKEYEDAKVKVDTLVESLFAEPTPGVLSQKQFIQLVRAIYKTPLDTGDGTLSPRILLSVAKAVAVQWMAEADITVDRR